MKNKLFFSPIIIILFFTTAIYSQSHFTGFWKGQINIANKNISFQIKISYKGKYQGKLSIPEQNAFDLQMAKLKIDSNKISFDILSSPQTASFSSDLVSKDSIQGTFSQLGMKGTFFLKRAKPDVNETALDSLENNFISKEVVFYNGKIKFAGTLTLPDTIGKFPAVVLLTGSGQQNRDENIFGFKIFKIIAAHLTEDGYAVLRFDDRGIGGSTTGETTATTAEYADDGLSAIQFLKTQKNIIKDKIGLLGHSEGGLASVIAGSASEDVAFIILMAGPSVSGGDLILYQLKTILKAQNISEKIIAKKLRLEKELIAAIKRGEDLQKYKTDLYKSALDDIKLLPPEKRNKIKNDSAYAENQATAQLQALNNPWLKFFITFNPTSAIEELNCPVLILFGGKDMQVPIELNKKPFELAFKNGGDNDYKIIVFPNANHLFQKAGSGMPDEYKTLDKKFVSGFIPAIVKWLNLNVKGRK